jgi:hypothetical protein
MTEIKNIKLVLDYYFNNFKDQYVIATSLLLYVDTSTESAIKEEISKRAIIFKDDNVSIDEKCQISLNILNDLKEMLGLKYGENNKILYDEEKITKNYKFLSDFCKGASMINSLYSKEYKNMAGDAYKRMLSILLTKINNNFNEDQMIIETKTKNLDTIIQSEIKYISKIKSNLTNEGIKLINFHDMIAKNIKEVQENNKIKLHLRKIEIEHVDKKNKTMGEAIGCFIVFKQSEFNIKIEDCNFLINEFKNTIKKDVYDTTNENINKIEDVAIDFCNNNFKKKEAGEKDWETIGIKYNTEDFIRINTRFKLNKNISKHDLIQEIREINSHLKNNLDSVTVKKIVEEEFDENNLEKNKKAENNKNNIKLEVKEKEKKESVFSKFKNFWYE